MGKWLDDSFVFYASYHDNKVNQWIHIVCVPLLIFTGFVMLSFTPALIAGSVDIKGALPAFLGQLLPEGSNYIFNWNMLFAALYTTYYTFVELPGIAGLLAALLVVSAYIYSTHLYTVYNANDDLFKLAMHTHIVCWVAQFLGHGVWEGRSPALLDNLFQAFAMAPLFVLMEVMFMFGYRSDFRRQIQQQVDKNVKEYKDSKDKGKAAAGKAE
jgi:uncharacterized membrane protein YGL010W